MRPPLLPSFVIGSPTWVRDVRRLTGQINPDYWREFRPVPVADVRALERALNRRLPDDFRLFLELFGYGPFTDFGGNIYSPQEMVAGCPGPLWMLLGSADWASDDAQRRYYTSRGRHNPDPVRFTAAAVNAGGVSLLDLLQIGTDGQGGYLQVFVGERPGRFGSCVLRESQIEDERATFSDGLYRLLCQHWCWHHGIEDEGGGRG